MPLTVLIKYRFRYEDYHLIRFGMYRDFWEPPKKRPGTIRLTNIGSAYQHHGGNNITERNLKYGDYITRRLPWKAMGREASIVVYCRRVFGLEATFD